MSQHIVAPSILAADFLNLQKDILTVNNSNAQWLHVDVMDGSFVPNISFGQPIVKAIGTLNSKVMDVHLMIDHPEKYISQFRECGADVISVHIEATCHIHRLIQQIHASGAKAGVAINPGTPLSVLEPIIRDADMICLMSVNPGFGGQSFIPYSIDRIAALHHMITEADTETLIEVDGGIKVENAGAVLAAGADVLVAGSSVFRSEDPTASIEYLLKANK